MPESPAGCPIGTSTHICRKRGCGRPMFSTLRRFLRRPPWARQRESPPPGGALRRRTSADRQRALTGRDQLHPGVARSERQRLTVGTEALFWAPNPLGGCGAVIDTTLTAPSWAPAASIAADEPSERSQRPLAASHPHDGWDALDNVNDSEVAGVPTRTALASVGRNAKTNCCAGGAEWFASACARNDNSDPYTLCGADRKLTRYRPSTPASWLSGCAVESRTRARMPAWPPEYTN